MQIAKYELAPAAAQDSSPLPAAHQSTRSERRNIGCIRKFFVAEPQFHAAVDLLSKAAGKG